MKQRQWQQPTRLKEKRSKNRLIGGCGVACRAAEDDDGNTFKTHAISESL